MRRPTWKIHALFTAVMLACGLCLTAAAHVVAPAAGHHGGPPGPAQGRPGPGRGSPGRGRPGSGGTGKPQGLAATPYLGWSSWSTFRCTITGAGVRAQALAMHKTLQRSGYDYVNIDSDCANDTDAYGRKIYNPASFPQGIAPLAAYVHRLGEKLGVYVYPGIPLTAVQANDPILGTSYHARDIIVAPSSSAPSSSLCEYAGTFQNACKIDYTRPGAQAFINSWAGLLAADGADLIKLDGVSPGSDATGYNDQADVRAWHTALGRSGRTIQLIVSWHLDVSDAAFWQANANGWRTDDDIECYTTCPALTTWANPGGYVRDTILSRFFDAAPWAQFAGPGGWSNLDSLDIGNGAADGLTPTERQTAMTLWSIAGAPLYSGDDLTKLDPAGVRLLTNRRVIAVDQSGVAGHLVGAQSPYTSWADQQVWAQHERSGSDAVALFNLAGTPEPVAVTWQSLGFCGSAGVTDLWSGRDLGVWRNGLTETVPAHGSVLLSVQPGRRGPCPPAGPAPRTTFYAAAAPGNTLTAPASLSSCPACSGGEMAGNLYDGGAVQFSNVTVPTAGTYTLALSYAGDDERTGYVSVNGGAGQLIGFFPVTGGWTTLGTYQILVQLNAGTNTVTYLTHSGPGGLPSTETYSPNLNGITIGTYQNPAGISRQ